MLDGDGINDLCSHFVSDAYINQGIQELKYCTKAVKNVLSRRQLPEEGWSESLIERLFSDISMMDSNNFHANAGIGEREARIACPMVLRRNHGLAHGIGRSGDIAAEQPKAAGSSLMARICHFLVEDALKIAGLSEVGSLQVLPLATGMAMTLALMSCRAVRPSAARYVIWSRIDQKTCFKAMLSANLTPVVIELQQHGDELHTDVPAIRERIQALGSDQVVCVITTTSCFAPRAPDDVPAVAALCAELDVPHLVNNAYGVQSLAICKMISQACRRGRVDCVVQSTDKNFMVPVGGAVIWAPTSRPALVHAVAKAYPGRASAAAHIDLTMTLLYLGKQGWRRALARREALFQYMRDQLKKAAEEHGERLLITPSNPVSMAITLDTLTARNTGVTVSSAEGLAREATFLGSMLWQRCVSGARVVPSGKTQVIGGSRFLGYGSSCNSYEHTYLTAAAALGGTEAESDMFIQKLKKCLKARQKGMPSNACSTDTL